MKYGPYIIDGDPIAWARAVPAHATKIRMWDKQKQLKFAWGLQLANQHKHEPLMNQPVHVDLVFHMATPKYKSRSHTKYARYPHYYVPDLSNLIKFAEDAATGILWNDDCLISSINAKKIYGPTPQTVMTVTLLELRAEL